LTQFLFHLHTSCFGGKLIAAIITILLNFENFIWFKYFIYKAVM
jgi:hypothetical protein